jgi:hypothetical protein
MDTKIQQMRDQMKRIVHAEDGLTYPCMTGKVLAGSYNTGDMTVSVVLTAGDTTGETDNAVSVATKGVSINVTLSNNGGMYLVPTDGVNCTVLEVDGAGHYELWKADSYVDIVMAASNKITMNGGGLGGLTKTKELQTQINKLNTLVQHIVTVINGVVIDEPGSGSASALQAALKTAILSDEVGDFSGIENTNITQG